MEPIPKEKSDNSGLAQGNVEKKTAWNSPSNGDSEIKPVMGASSWPELSETTKYPSNKSSSDSLKSLGDGSSSSSSVLDTKRSYYLAQLELLATFQQKFNFGNCASASTTSSTVSQPQNQRSEFASHSDGGTQNHQNKGFASQSHGGIQNQKKEFASQSHAGTQNQYQRFSYKNQNQSHGTRRNKEHGNQNRNFHINFNFNGRGGFSPRGALGFVGHAPPPPPMHYVPIHQSFYPGPMVFPIELAPPLMYYHPRMPFTEPPPVLYQFQEASLETRIRNQIHYYFSPENLSRDEFLRKRMNDEGFVHIQFIAGFNKLKALTDNIQRILDSLQGSDVVELKGCEIRKRYIWNRFLLPPDLRVPFYPSVEDEMFGKVQNLSFVQNTNVGESSSNQRGGDKANGLVGSPLPSIPS